MWAMLCIQHAWQQALFFLQEEVLSEIATTLNNVNLQVEKRFKGT
jgi:hypothetical protein